MDRSASQEQVWQGPCLRCWWDANQAAGHLGQDPGGNKDRVICRGASMEAVNITGVLGEQHPEDWILLCFKYQQPSYPLNAKLHAWGEKGLRTQGHIFRGTKSYEKHMHLWTCKLNCGYYQENFEQTEHPVILKAITYCHFERLLLNPSSQAGSISLLCTLDCENLAIKSNHLSETSQQICVRNRI